MLYQLRSNSNVGSEQWVATNWRWRKQFEESGGVEVDNTDVLLVFSLCADKCRQGGIFGLVMNLWTRLGVFFLVICVTMCVGDSLMMDVSPAFLKAEETMQHVRGVVLAATIMAVLQVTVMITAWLFRLCFLYECMPRPA